MHTTNLFLVGAGALGCEFLKFFALTGLGSKGGSVQCTDNDSIEVSNLNRQFLFRNTDVTKFKSEVACREATKINSDLNLTAQRQIVSKDTESVYNDTFWDSLDIVLNAVDNVKARNFIDEKVVF